MIEVVEYDPKWPKIFEKESKPIKVVLGDNCISIHHFGSTAVPGLAAKPKIDILAVVKAFSAIDISALVKLGFENRGEIIPTGRYFSKKNPKVHLHVFEKENPRIEEYLKFRDHLRDHLEDREAYAKLKKDLAPKHHDGMGYCYAKTNFVNEILSKLI